MIASGRGEQIAALYEQQRTAVKRAVSHRARVPEAVIEDACQTAWVRLCEHPDVTLEAQAAVK